MAANKQKRIPASVGGRGWSLKQNFGAGADGSMGAPITITGIKKGDIVVSAIEMQDTSPVLVNMLEVVISDADEVTGTTDTSGNIVLVTWWTKS